MPTIAQKLCCDIVETGIKPSEDTAKKQSTGKIINSSSKCNTRAPHTCYTAKTKNETPHTSYTANTTIGTPYTSGCSIKQLKSGVTFLKTKIADSSVNTLVSGPLRCGNNCITSIRKHNHQSTCKCGLNRKPSRVHAKEIQTLSKVIYPLTDRACTQHVETVSCGTQFLDNKERMLKKGGILEKKSKSPLRLAVFKKHYSKHEPDFDKYMCLHKDSNTNQQMGCTISKPSMRYLSAKRWALTHYPVRGPDF